MRTGKVAVIGTGAMGTSIAGRLMATGFETTVYDIRAEALHPLLAMGAKRAIRISDCTGSDVVLIVVANDAQVEDVITGPEGILHNLSGEINPVVVIVSTVLPETVRRLGELCRAKGIGVMDAPVSGSHVAAKSGDLSVMIGGTEETFERVKPVLSAIGRRLYHVGGLGAGETVKLINNMIGVANIWLTMEALATAVRNELSLDVLLPIMDASSGSNYYIRNWATARTFLSDVARDLSSAQSNLSLSTKDLEHAQEQAELAGQASPLLAGLIKGLKELTPQHVVDQWSKVLNAISKPTDLP
jgi:3-hydroxyisobutyrate dehydrogenase-like beta-hydroxyacid dehydrogenase